MQITTLFYVALQALSVVALPKTAKPPAPPKPILRTYNWNVDWVSASPDGTPRPFVGINGQWPCPSIIANAGDTIKINVVNNLGNETTAIHFHGLFQQGSNNMDGPAMVTQCPIVPGQSFVYEFKLNQTGTYWYHAHVGGQYIDGLRGSIIIHDFNAPFKYDTEYVMTLSDLYHTQAPALINYYQSADNFNNYGGTEPVPDAFLINEAQNVQFNITAGKTYLFHIISTAAFAPFWVQFDQHQMTVVEMDGVYTVPYSTDQIYITAAQRYTVLITTKTDATQNFAVVAQANTAMFDTNKFPQDGSYVSTVSATLVYNPSFGAPPQLTINPEAFCDGNILPYDQLPMYGQPYPGGADVNLEFIADFAQNENGQYRGQLNGVSFLAQKVPTLYTALTAPKANPANPAGTVMDPTIYGPNSNAQVIPYGSVVEIQIANHDSQAHPFHLHGHSFQVVANFGNGGDVPDSPYFPAIPMRRDVVLVQSEGSATIRFIADNPGIQLLHCHIEWHVEAGLSATIIEAPDVLQKSKMYTPNSAKTACAAFGKTPMKGNAGGNSKNWLDLSQAPTTPAQNLWGALYPAPS